MKPVDGAFNSIERSFKLIFKSPAQIGLLDLLVLGVDEGPHEDDHVRLQLVHAVQHLIEPAQIEIVHRTERTARHHQIQRPYNFTKNETKNQNKKQNLKNKKKGK